MSHATWTHASSIFLRVVWPALCSHRDRYDLCISLSPVFLPFFLSFFLPVRLCFCPPPPPVVCEDREEPRSWFQYLWRHQRPGEPLQTLRYGTTRPGPPANRSLPAPPTALPQSCHGNSRSLTAAFRRSVRVSVCWGGGGPTTPGLWTPKAKNATQPQGQNFCLPFRFMSSSGARNVFLGGPGWDHDSHRSGNK